MHQRLDSRHESSIGAKEVDAEECSSFDILHTEQGFAAFGQWYRRILTSGSNSNASSTPRPELGLLWPQAFCPPLLLHEYAFMELLRVFADCTDSEAFDLFDILDCNFMGMLGPPQVYFAMCLIAALGSRQLTKFLYFHSTQLFAVLSKGCIASPPEHVSWPRMLVFFRLLGAPGHLVSRVGAEGGGPFASVPGVAKALRYTEFLEVMFSITLQLDRGTEFGDSTVINESDRNCRVRSRTCAVL